MLNIPATSRGFADHGWLKSHHTFSFANYYDPSRMGFGALRVINDDFIAPAMGFGAHPHQDMEIVTIPLRGTLAHKDSVGNSTEIKKGEVQIMSAGTGIRHSEFNASASEPVELLQIWVHPKYAGLKPRYDQKSYSVPDNELVEVVSPSGEGSAIQIIQDAWFSLGRFDQGKEIKYEAHMKGHGIFVFLLSGSIRINNHLLETRDSIGFEGEEVLSIKAQASSEFLIIEVPM